MKLYSPDKSVLMEVTAIKPHPDGLVIEGKIMGAMPMKAILRPEEMKEARKLAGWPVLKRAIGMLFVGKRTA